MLLPFSRYGGHAYVSNLKIPGVRAREYDAADFEMEAQPMMMAVAEGFKMEDANVLHEVVVARDVATNDDTEPEPAEKPATIRCNFNETAFFYPNLMTDQDGVVTLSFKLPESLTKWKFLAFAHTEDVDYGLLQATAVASKDFMVQPNMPRFVRTGDNITITTRIINQCDNPVNGKATIRLIDPNNDKVVYTQTCDFAADAKTTTSASFEYKVGDDYNMLICEVFATDGKTSDGERN